MNTKTIWFRGALSLAVLWLAAVGFWAYSSYSDEYESIEGYIYSIPLEETESCDYNPLDFTHMNPIYTKPNYEERQSCRERIYEKWRKLRISSNDFYLTQSIKDFGYYGLIPVALLLFIAAFWRSLTLGVGYIAQRYVGWLRGNPPTA